MDFLHLQNVFREEDIRAHLRFHATLVLAAGDMRRRSISILNKPFLDALILNRPIVVEQIPHDAAALLFIEPPLIIPVGRPSHTVQLIQNAKLFVQKRRLRQHILTLQVRADSRHASNEILSASAFVDNLFPIPGSNGNAFGAGFVLRPRKTRLIVSIQSRIALRQWPNVIRNAERNKRQQLRPLLFQDRIELRLRIEDCLHFL